MELNFLKKGQYEGEEEKEEEEEEEEEEPSFISLLDWMCCSTSFNL